MVQYRPAFYKKHHFGLRLKTLSRATALGVCHKKFKYYTNGVYAANGPNFLGPISYGTQPVETQFLMVHSTFLRAGLYCIVNLYNNSRVSINRIIRLPTLIVVN